MRPVLFEVGPLHLYGYGVMIVLGGVMAFRFLRRRAARAGLRSDEDFWLLVNTILFSGFVGGRLLYVVEYTRLFSWDFWTSMVSPSRGFSVLGAFVGVPLGVWFYCRARGIPFLRLLDTLCVMAPFWHVFGRVGCLLAGCCHGRPTDAPWGIVFRDPRAMVPSVWLGTPLHPTQLYEAAGNALIAAALYRLLIRTEKAPPGAVASAYFAAYGVMRFFEEFYRGDTVPLGVFGLTAGQGLGLCLVAAAVALNVWRSVQFSRPS